MRIMLTAALITTTVAAFSSVLRDSNTNEGPRTAKANVVTVTTVDYAFQAPDTIAAGRTTLRLVNNGKDFHHIWPGRNGRKTVVRNDENVGFFAEFFVV